MSNEDNTWINELNDGAWSRLLLPDPGTQKKKLDLLVNEQNTTQYIYKSLPLPMRTRLNCWANRFKVTSKSTSLIADETELFHSEGSCSSNNNMGSKHAPETGLHNVLYMIIWRGQIRELGMSSSILSVYPTCAHTTFQAAADMSSKANNIQQQTHSSIHALRGLCFVLFLNHISTKGTHLIIDNQPDNKERRTLLWKFPPMRFYRLQVNQEFELQKRSSMVGWDQVESTVKVMTQ